MPILPTIILLGALQGFIVAALLLSSARQKPEERLSRRLLALIILIIATACLAIYLEHIDWWTSSTVGSLLSALLPLIVVMPLGPLAYFYIRSLEEPDFRLTKAYRPHFYPVVIDLFQHVAVVVVIILMILGFFRKTNGVQGFGIVFDYYNQYADISAMDLIDDLSHCGDAVSEIGVARSMRRDGGRGSWPRTFLRVLWAFDLLWLAFNIPYELPRIGDILISRFDWYPLYIPLVVMIYYLGVKGYFISYRAESVPVAKAVGVSISEAKLAQIVSILKKSMEEEKALAAGGSEPGEAGAVLRSGAEVIVRSLEPAYGYDF